MHASARHRRERLRGHAVCAKLLARGHDVTALARRPGDEPPGTRPVRGELGDAAGLREILAAEHPDAAVHLAAEIASQRSAVRIRAVNVDGTRRLVEACRAAGGPRFVFSSTVVTGEAHGALLDETTPLPRRRARSSTSSTTTSRSRSTTSWR